MNAKKDTKKKVFIFTPYFYPEPFPINTFSDELSKKIHNLTVVTSLPNYRNYNFYKGYSIFGPYIENKGNIRIIRLPVIPRFSNSFISIFLFYLSFFISSFLFLSVFSLYNFRKFDHVMTFCGSPVYVGYLGKYASLLMNCKDSMWIQDIWPEAIQTSIGFKSKYLASILSFIQTVMWKTSNLLFAQSESLVNYLKYDLKIKNVELLYNPPRDEAIDPKKLKKESQNKETHFLYMGNIGKVQHLDMLIESFNFVNDENIFFHVCGDGSERRTLEEKSKNRNIRWYGWVNGKDLKKVIEICDFFVLSLNSFKRQSLIIPSKLQSYLKFEKPIICLSEGASKDLVHSNNMGLTANEISKSSIIDMIKKASNLSENDRKIMSDNSIQFYNNSFKVEKIVDRFIQNI